MISLVRLEIQKLFRRKFVLVLLLIYGVVLLFFMIYAGNPNRFSSILTSEGDVLKGRKQFSMKRSWQKATVRFPIRMSRKFWRRTQESLGSLRMRTR